MRTSSPPATPLATVRFYQPLILFFCVHTLNDNNICVFDLLITKQTTIKITTDDNLCSSYDSGSAIDLHVCTNNSVTDTSTDIDTSSCNPDDTFY